jgi:hypothetical protein
VGSHVDHMPMRVSLFCARRERPRRSRTAEKRDENGVAYKENEWPWDDCRGRWCNQKAKINQALTTLFILQGRPRRPVRNSFDHLVGHGE